MNFKLIFIFSFLVSSAWSDVILTSSVKKTLITDQMEIAFSNVDENKYENLEFKPHSSKALSIGYTNNATWLKVTFDNPSNIEKNFNLYFDSALAGRIEGNILNQNNLTYIGSSGSNVYYPHKTIYATVPAFPIMIPPRSSLTFVFKRTGIHRFDGRVFITDPEVFISEERIKETVIFIYTGAVLALFLYNLFIGIFTKNTTYYLYSGFIFSMGGIALNLIGGMDRLFANIAPVSDGLMFFSSSAIAFAMAFTNSFLNSVKTFPKFKYFFYPVLISGILHFILFPILRPYLGGLMGHSIDITLMLGISSMFFIGILSLIKGNRFAYFYTASWGILFTSAFCWFGMTYQLLPQSTFTKYALLWGNLIEMLILSLGLAYRIVILNQEKESAELKARENQRYQMLLRVVLHDIANPMTVVKSYHHIIKRMLDTKFDLDKLKDYLTKMTVSVDVVSEIIQSIRYQELELKENGKKQLKPVELKVVFEKLSLIFEKQLKDKELKIILPDTDYKVLADQTLLINNVFSNLISNAIKFSYKGSNIEVHTFKDEDTITIAIQDYGTGLTDAQIEEFNNKGRITSMTGTEGEKGTGYGMLLVKNYVEIFGGDITLSNTSIKDEKSGTLIKIKLKEAN